MTPRTDYTPHVLERIADILIDEYERSFKPVYEDAVDAIDGLPLEPCEEVRNTFDHFALATGAAFMHDGREVPQSFIEAKEASPRRPKEPIEDAEVSLLQARGHLASGRFYCLQHQIVGLLYKMRAAVREIKDAVLKPQYDERIRALVDRLIAIPRLVAERQFDPTLIRQRIEEFDAQCDSLARLAVEFLRLALEINASVESQPS